MFINDAIVTRVSEFKFTSAESVKHGVKPAYPGRITGNFNDQSDEFGISTHARLPRPACFIFM